MAKANNANRKRRYEAYKNSGRKITNKQKRQDDHKKRMEKFAKRREEGKAYEYKPNPYPKGSKEYVAEQNARARKNQTHKTQYQIWESAMKLVDNEVRKEKELMKKEKESRRAK